MPDLIGKGQGTYELDEVFSYPGGLSSSPDGGGAFWRFRSTYFVFKKLVSVEKFSLSAQKNVPEMGVCKQRCLR